VVSFHWLKGKKEEQSVEVRGGAEKLPLAKPCALKYKTSKESSQNPWRLYFGIFRGPLIMIFPKT
jgi:hypothetical protein